MGGTTYFFDAYDNDALYADSEGIKCRTLADMRREASRILMELATDNFSADDRLRKLTVIARSGAHEGGTTMTLTFTAE